MSVPYINTQEINDAGDLCQDPETKGFDLQAGQSWIYPTNYPVRDYQYNIIQEALHKNTLVSLPTGLGKTFIAAVVMYNFYRWYPHDKVIFMAPTRPLVKQQMDACYNIMAIPQDVTAELTGSKLQQSRTEIWQKKRVFFITPQVLQNDLAPIIELGSKIKCLVFDEAHRAKGNHAYCEVVRKLSPKNKLFRVLALSATPGNSSRDVIEVMQNLLIAHVEFRSEESPDVKPYVFERALETVVVPLGEKLQQIKDLYVRILERYTRNLIQYKVIYGNCCNLTKGKIFMVMKEFQAKNSGNRLPNYSEIMKTLNICVTLYHAYETLIRCGLRAFLNFYEEHINNPLLSGNIDLRRILDDLRGYLGPGAEVQPLPDGTFTSIPPATKFGHPKFYKLRDILISHFNNCDSSTRVIIFFEYRESASEAYALLSQSYPMIKPRVFVGQGSGVTQRDQINTVKAFREGSCNTLLSTCIGEEGLDVGEVDLIVCFDIANKSPIRMIQRMGRTGRKKEGRVVVLVTEGKEQQTLKECLIYKSNLGNFVNSSEQLEPGKYRDNPKMIPSYVHPKCQKMFITVKRPVLKDNNLKSMLKKMSDGPKFSEDLEIVEISERIKTKIENLWRREYPLQCEVQESRINFAKHLEKQRSLQPTGQIKQSKQSEMLVSLLQFADSKRFNLPVTQQLSKFGNFSENKLLKQGDIRAMFAKPTASVSSQEILSSQVFNFEKEKDVTQTFPPALFEEISAFLSIDADDCKTCNLLFECPKMINYKCDSIDLKEWVQPDLSILDAITARDLEVFADSLSPKSKKIHDGDLLEIDNDIFDNVTFSNETIKEGSFAYEIPRSFDKILDSFRLCPDAEDQSPPEEKSLAYEPPKNFGKILDVFEKSITKPSQNNEELTSFDYSEVLTFFKLSSLDELFVQDEPLDLDKTNETIIYTPDLIQHSSPDLFEQSPDLFASAEKPSPSPLAEPESPILCTYDKMQQIKLKKRLFERPTVEEVPKKPNLANLNQKRRSFFESTRNEKTPAAFDISDICDLGNFGLAAPVPKNQEKAPSDDLDISVVCDLSVFGLGPTQSSQKTEKQSSKKQTPEKTNPRELSVDDLCDLGDFFGTAEPVESQKAKKNTDYDLFYCSISPQKNNSVIVDLTDSPEKSNSQRRSGKSPQKARNCFKNENSAYLQDNQQSGLAYQNRRLRNAVVDLTDSDFDSSPVKTKPSQDPNKTLSQLSITQMLSLVAKTDEKSDSQKENATPKRNKEQKTTLTLSTKKNALKLKQNTPRSSQKKTHSPRKPQQKKFNISLVGDSDDEFEDTCRSPIFAKPLSVKKNPVQKASSSRGPVIKKRKRLFCEYIDAEAELSEDERVPVSDDEDSGEDCFEASFVTDETQDVLNNTSMHAKYLQSVKSPVRGKFKIPEKPRFNITNVFSQEVSNEDNTYVHDSFCVNTEDVCEDDAIDELELLEKKLKEMRRSKKRKKSENCGAKRKRIVLPQDDSD